jgi:hypothetical protein
LKNNPKNGASVRTPLEQSKYTQKPMKQVKKEGKYNFLKMIPPVLTLFWR